MKILMPNHFPLQGSGSGIYPLNVAMELVRGGHEVMAIVPEHQPVSDYPFETRTILFNDPEDAEQGPTQLDFDFPCSTTHPKSNTQLFHVEHFRNSRISFSPPSQLHPCEGLHV